MKNAGHRATSCGYIGKSIRMAMTPRSKEEVHDHQVDQRPGGHRTVRVRHSDEGLCAISPHGSDGSSEDGRLPTVVALVRRRARSRRGGDGGADTMHPEYMVRLQQLSSPSKTMPR